MTPSIVLWFPIPRKELFPNNRPRSHLYFGTLVKQRRLDIKYDTIRQLRMAGFPDDMKWKEAFVSIEWFAKTKMFPDADNALSSLKSTLDGIVDAGILDDDRRLSFAPIIFEKDKDEPRVEIMLRERGEDE